MSLKELAFIKKIQAEFFRLFGSKLIIDFPSMIGQTMHVNVTTNLRMETMSDSDLQIILQRNNVTLDEIIQNKVARKDKRLKDFLIDFCSTLQRNPKLCYKRNAELIGRDRSLVYYYLNLVV